MKYFLVILVMSLMGCADNVKTCDEQPHQAKCPGHGGHSHE